jgi:hypothetical protein
MAPLPCGSILNPDWCILTLAVHKNASLLSISTLETLWLEFQNDICDNLSICIPNPIGDCVCNYSLFLHNWILSEFEYSLENFPKMPLSYKNWFHLNGNNLFTKQLNYNCDFKLQLY